MQMGTSDFDLLARYWDEEPWGPYRDNLHAALIAREVRRPFVSPQKNKLSDFMVTGIAERAEKDQQKISGMFALFKTVANRVRRADIKLPKRKRRR